MSTNIHECARRMVQQSPRPMALEDAYRELGKRGTSARRRRNYGKTTVDPDEVAKSFGKARLPYADHE